jgi:hypothetical protein
MCQPNKFLEGKLVFLPRLRAAAIIGHCCASSETRNEAEREYQAREALRLATDRLLDELPKLPLTLSRLAAIAPAIDAAQSAFEKVRRNGGQFRRALRRASKGDSELTVAEVVERSNGGPSGLRTSGSTMETRDIRFGRLAGRAMLADKCSLADDLQSCRVALRIFPPMPDENTVLDYVAALDETELKRLDAELTRALGVLSGATARLAEMRSFFAPSNIERINSWAAHPSSPLWMRASLRRFEKSKEQFLFEIRGRGEDRLGALIHEAFWRD